MMTIETKEVTRISNDCKDILESNNLKFSIAGEYLQIGDIPEMSGWVFNISVIRLEFTKLLYKILPILIKENVPFKIAKDKATVKAILDGGAGVKQLGKVICIYPSNNEEQLIALARTLISLTKGFRGPAIRTDRLLGGCLYTNFYYSTSTAVAGNSMPSTLNDVHWPFGEFAEEEEERKKPLLNYRYRPLSTIKLDLKGKVIHGNYFKSLFSIKQCVIKEGIKNMWADELGRDVVDRIKWQYEIYTDLAGQLPIPDIFDIFEEQGNTYLAMEFIKGDSLNNRIISLYDENSWFQLPHANRLILIEYCLKIINIIGQLHQKGYVHRDITPVNFIIDKKETVYLIDMELAFSTIKQKPSPPFRLGTEGFMSPEQKDRQTPTVKEDVFALGAFMLFVFTGILPSKVNMRHKELQSFLNFFILDTELNALINNCLAAEPDCRPDLSTIRQSIYKFQDQLKQSFRLNQRSYSPAPPNARDIKATIENGIRSLGRPEASSESDLWVSRKDEDVSFSGAHSSERIVLPEFSRGISGVLFVLSRAHRLGYDINSSMNSYAKNLEHILVQSVSNSQDEETGLLIGTSGQAVALNEAILSGLLPKQKHGFLESCFKTDLSRGPNLGVGLAGQGMALLFCHQNLDTQFLNSRLQGIIDILLESQRKDGSWINFRDGDKQKDNIIGHCNGTSGIICFLIAAARFLKNDQYIPRLEKGLEWVIQKGQKKKFGYSWAISTKSTSIDNQSLAQGTPGTILALIKAYRLLGEPSYKTIAEGALHQLPKQPITRDFSQMHGLAGLGEVYLEAYRTFNTEEWYARANWISNVFSHTVLSSEKIPGFWAMNFTQDLDTDFMTGFSGILHFLIRTQITNLNIDHPLIG